MLSWKHANVRGLDAISDAEMLLKGYLGTDILVLHPDHEKD
jgi:hypothetical protein